MEIQLSKNDKRFIPIIVSLSIVIPLAVLALILLPENLRVKTGIENHIFPLFHAVINGTTALLLIIGLVFIKRKNIALHRTSMVSALLLSTVFLLSYVFSKLSHAPIPYGGEGIMRPIYFFILITHIILSVAVLPLALLSVYRAFTQEYAKHKKLVRFTFPIWLYVAITGVMVYLFMMPYYV